MNQKLIEELLKSSYEFAKDDGEIFIDKFLGELSEGEKVLLDGFHPGEIMTVNRDDDYFLSARANTFVVMFGTDETSGYEKTVLIQANHKGLMHFLMFPY